MISSHFFASSALTIPLRREDKCILCKNKKLTMCLLMIHWQIPVLHYSVFSGQQPLLFPSIRKVVLSAQLARLYIQNNISRLFATSICIATSHASRQFDWKTAAHSPLAHWGLSHSRKNSLKFKKPPTFTFTWRWASFYSRPTTSGNF